MDRERRPADIRTFKLKDAEQSVSEFESLDINDRPEDIEIAIDYEIERREVETLRRLILEFVTGRSCIINGIWGVFQLACPHFIFSFTFRIISSTVDLRGFIGNFLANVFAVL
jgi:hypothetical protein